MFEYTASGLNGIFLRNGYERVETPYGEGFVIEDLEGLHLAIATDILRQSSPMTGHQFRFLRKEQDLIQSELAAMLRIDVQTVANWEKKGVDSVPGPADFAMRAFYGAFRHLQGEPFDIRPESPPVESAVFLLDNNQWKEVQAA